jgi:hypothetical protein
VRSLFNHHRLSCILIQAQLMEKKNILLSDGTGRIPLQLYLH